MDPLAMLLKPAPFKVAKKGDPEQTLQDFLDYIELFEQFLTATNANAGHTAQHAQCSTCVKCKAMLVLIGGKEIDSLFKHVGKVLQGDSYDQAINKVKEGISKQTNQSMARFKLMREMSQGGRPFAEWWPLVKEQAERCTWTGYDAKAAAGDAILQQCDNVKLQKKIIAEDLKFEDIVKYGVALEQGEKKVQRVNDDNKAGRKEVVSAVDTADRIQQLTREVKALKAKSKGKKKCSTCVKGNHEPGKCYAINLECYECHRKGHIKGASICSKDGPKKVKKVQVDPSDTESEQSEEGVGRIKEQVRQASDRRDGQDVHADMVICAMDHGRESKEVRISPVIDTGVNKTLICEKDWKKMVKADPLLKAKRCRVKFTPYGTEVDLPMIGRTKAVLSNGIGGKISTIVYIVRDSSQSLLGRFDAEDLGIVQINPLGSNTVGVGKLRQEGAVKEVQKDDARVQEDMDGITKGFSRLFQGIGKAKVDPIHIYIDEKVKPVQQKQRKVAFHYMERLRAHLDELCANGVISGPLDSEEATGWISNIVITGKKWDSSKIRVNLDLRDMEEAVRPSHFPMPTADDLRHQFAGSDRYTTLDMNHAFHQFPLDEESQELFVFWTPWGLYKFNTLAIGIHTASSECQEKLRRVLEGLDGVCQIQDDIVVHGRGKGHDERLVKVLERLQEYGFTLRKEKCHWGKSSIVWFGHVFSAAGMSPDPDKVQHIKDWPVPENKSEVKSFLQTVQFCACYIKPHGGKTYSDVTAPLRKLTNKSTRFVWSKECGQSFEELKELLSSESVLANYEVGRKTRLYVDHGPQGVAATVAQLHAVRGSEEEVWRPVEHSSRALTKTEQGYSKVEGESLGILNGVKKHKKYLYGTQFEVVVDHEPLVSLYNSKKELPARVAKHVDKLKGFQFKVVYQSGSKNPADYGSRHPPKLVQHSKEERDELGIEDEEEDMEIIVNRVDVGYVPEAVTLEVLKQKMVEDKLLKGVMKDVQSGKVGVATKGSKYEKVFEELSCIQGVLMRGNRAVVPDAVVAEILELAHEGHPAEQSMLQQLRQTLWWPNISKDVKEFVQSCGGCAAALPRNTPPTMKIRETPDRPWQHCSADYKGPIAGKYYFHVLIDNYSRWPEVAMTTSTSMDKLKKVLSDSFSIHGIPETITHDNGPPYNGREWQVFAKEQGFKPKACSPEHPESNGIAERFMSVLVKVIHAAVAEGKDPRLEVKKRLLNYRNTVHPSTGASPASLMMGREVRTKLPAMMEKPMTKVHVDARSKDEETRQKRKAKADKDKRAKDKEYTKGDKVLLSQRKKVTTPPFDPVPYYVEDVKHDQVVIKRGSKKLVRNKAQLKLLNPRPKRLSKEDGLLAQKKQDDSSDDEDYSMEAIRDRGGRPAANFDDEGALDPNILVEEEREAIENANEDEGGPQETDAESYVSLEEGDLEVDAGESLDDSEDYEVDAGESLEDSEDYGHEMVQAGVNEGTVETVDGAGQGSDRQQRQRNAAEAQRAKNKMFHFF